MTWLLPLAVLGFVGVGLYGLLIGRNLVMLLVALQLLAKGAIVGFVWAGLVSGQPLLGQALATTVIVADTVVAVVALALSVQVRRGTGTLDIRGLSRLRG